MPHPFHLDRRRWLASLAAVPALAHAEKGASAPLVMVNTIYPPFVNAPGDPGGEGLDVEIAREVLRRIGHTMELQVVPWRRVLLMLEYGHADFTTTISRRDDRDRYLEWSNPYRLGAAYRFYALKSSKFKLNSLDDLRGRRLGLIAGFNYPPPITEVPNVRLERTGDIAMLTKMLIADRTDFMVVTAIAGAWEIRKLGLADRLEQQPYEYTSTSPNYLAFSKRRPIAGKLPAINAALQAMVKDGSMARIQAKYLF